VRNRKKAIVYRCTIGACVCKTTQEVFQLFFIVENDLGGFAPTIVVTQPLCFFPNGLLLLDFCITFYQEKVMKIKRCMKTTDCTLLHAFP
jgi:hypothetical protein